MFTSFGGGAVVRLSVKRLFAVFVCILLGMSSLTFIVFSADAVAVSAEDIVAGEDNLLVPVRVSSDTNVMGFKLSLSFSDEQVKVKKISRGSVTAKGSFTDNLGLESGKVDVVWHNTSEVAADGTLFVLTLDATGVTENTEITVEFSQPDTFNEAYEDVVFNCSDIKIVKQGVSVESQTTTLPVVGEDEPLSENPESTAVESTAPNKEVVEYDGSQVTDSVNNALDGIGSNTIYDIPEEYKEAFVESVNNNMNVMLDTDNVYFDSFSQVVEAYEESYIEGFVNNVSANIESDILNDLLNDTLKEFGAETIDDVTDKKQFVQTIETKIQEQYPDAEKISDYMAEDIVIKAIKELYITNEQEMEQNEKTDAKTFTKDNNIILIVFVVVIFIALIISTILIIKKKQKVSTKESKEKRV